MLYGFATRLRNPKITTLMTFPMKQVSQRTTFFAIILIVILFTVINFKYFTQWMLMKTADNTIPVFSVQSLTAMAGVLTPLQPSNTGQFSRTDNLILFKNTFIFPFDEFKQQKNIPPFVVLYPETFSVCNFSESKKLYTSIAQMKGISLIFVKDQFMSHFFHIFEHLLSTYAGIQELYKNNNHSVEYAFFPNMDGKKCFGEYNLNIIFLRLLWPNIRIICGQKMKDISRITPFALQHSFISMRFSLPGIDYNQSASCIWNQMNGEYIHVIKQHSFSFAATVISNLKIKTSNMPHFKEISSHLKYRMCFISRESASRRSMHKSIRKRFLKIRETHSYFGDKFHLFDFLLLRLEAYEFEEQIAVISTCNLIISIHGNGLSHVLWMALQSSYPKRKLVVELLPGTNVNVNDYMMQSEFAHAYHIQWDVSGDEIRSGSLDFGDPTHCPKSFYTFDFRYLNTRIKVWSNDGIYHMFDAVQKVWKFIIKDGHFYGMNLTGLRTELKDIECIVARDGKTVSVDYCADRATQ